MNLKMIDEYKALCAQWGAFQDIRHYQAAKDEFGTLDEAWKKATPAFFMSLGMGWQKAERLCVIRRQLDFEWIARTMSRLGVQLFHIDDPDYPEPLKPLPDAPPFLFVRGKLPLWYKALGVVGTRRMTPYGRFMTQRLVADLVRNDFPIISGLAYGVDACAHETTLKYNGSTVAVLGTGVDFIYPSGNEPLANRILSAGGAIVSEFPLGTQPLAHHFPQRNRIISGLSKGVLVIEGGEKSGALITAERALAHGRPVFAVPCNVSHGFLSGTNQLIRDGAHMAETVKDILLPLGFTVGDFSIPRIYSSEEKQLADFIHHGGKTIDELAEETTYSVARLSEILILMQLKGFVRQVGQKWVLL